MGENANFEKNKLLYFALKKTSQWLPGLLSVVTKRLPDIGYLGMLHVSDRLHCVVSPVAIGQGYMAEMGILGGAAWQANHLQPAVIKQSATCGAVSRVHQSHTSA